MLALLVLILEELRPQLNQTAVALGLVLLVVLVAVWLGRGQAFFSLILAGAAFNFFLIEPLRTLRIKQLRWIRELAGIAARA